MKILALKRYLLSIFTVLALASCSSSAIVSPSQKLSLVKLGMDKDQVIEIMGVAGAISAQSPYEIYLYSHLAGTGDRIGAFLGGFGAGSIGIGDAYIEQQRNNHLFVRFKDEVVESYGRRGDFDFMRVDVPVRQPNTGNSNNDNSFEMIQLENRQRQLEDQQRRLEDEQRYQNRPNPFPG